MLDTRKDRKELGAAWQIYSALQQVEAYRAGLYKLLNNAKKKKPTCAVMKFRNGPIKMPRLEFHLPYNPAAAGLIEG